MSVFLRSLALFYGLMLIAAEGIPAQVVIEVGKPGLSIPADFLGISYEKNALVEPHFKPGNAVLINLHRNLGAGTLRLGGNKVELTRWQAEAPASLDKSTGLAAIGHSTLDDLYGFLKATEWKCLHGLNLAGNLPESSADEAAYALKIGASSVLAFEVGNEPNLYPNHDLRKKGYDCPTYLPEAAAAIKVIRARNPGIILAGPATARRTDHWFEDAVAGLNCSRRPWPRMSRWSTNTSPPRGQPACVIGSRSATPCPTAAGPASATPSYPRSGRPTSSSPWPSTARTASTSTAT
ncbi:MAG: hypothetical protein EBV31_02015 [Verrucomicrobia bacterium]|nr:hypothetical protein [Verrucomicrobiota bacterium]